MLIIERAVVGPDAANLFKAQGARILFALDGDDPRLVAEFLPAPDDVDPLVAEQNFDIDVFSDRAQERCDLIAEAIALIGCHLAAPQFVRRR